MNPEETVAALRRTVVEIDRLVPFSRRRWDGERLLQLGVMKLWIDVGNYAKAYMDASGMYGVEPWSKLYGYRSVLSHQLPEDLDEDRLWQDANSARRVLEWVDAATPT